MANIIVEMSCKDKNYKAEIPSLNLFSEGKSRLEAMINLRIALKKYITKCSKNNNLPIILQSYYRLIVINKNYEM